MSIIEKKVSPVASPVRLLLRGLRPKGFGLLEIVIGLAVIALFLFGVLAVARLSLRLSEENANNIKAAFLLEEGTEALKILRDAGWQQNIASLAISGDYYLSFNNGQWQADSSNIFIDGLFERKLRLENVYRDSQDRLAESGALDANTKKASLFVSWRSRGATTTKTISTYLTNLFDN